MAELFFTLEFLNFVLISCGIFSNLKKISHTMWQWTKNFQQLSPTEKSSLFFSNTKRHKLARKRVLYMWQADKTFIKTNSNFVFGYSTRPLFPFDSLFFLSHCLFDRTKLSFPSNPIRFEFLWLTSQRAFFSAIPFLNPFTILLRGGKNASFRHSCCVKGENMAHRNVTYSSRSENLNDETRFIVWGKKTTLNLS